MVLKRANPAPLAKATGLGKVFAVEAIDDRETTAPLAGVQQQFIRRRVPIAPALIATIAALAFGEVRA